MEISAKSAIIISSLIGFGLVYNIFVAWLGSRKRGYTALLVAFGSAITLVGVAALDLNAAILTLICFVASGTPMILGDIQRYITERTQAENEARQIARQALELDQEASNDQT